MAINRCHKEYVEVCEILVVVDAPAPLHLDFYLRLRFDLLASSSPLGIFLWSALHVMLLIVGGPAIWVLVLLTVFLLRSVLWFGVVFSIVLIFSMVACLIAAAVDLTLLLGRSIRFCWSLVGFLACHEPIDWRGGDCGAVVFWKDVGSSLSSLFWTYVPFGVLCMSGSLYEETKNQMLEMWHGGVKRWRTSTMLMSFDGSLKSIMPMRKIWQIFVSL